MAQKKIGNGVLNHELFPRFNQKTAANSDRFPHPTFFQCQLETPR
jgi:hypothetical protein